MTRESRGRARSRQLRAALVAGAVLSTLSGAACESLSGLSGGVEAGTPDSTCGGCLVLPDGGAGGKDVGHSSSHDATTDATRDAQRKPDSGGGLDAARDAPRDSPGDTSDAPACVPVDAAAVSLDAGSCPIPPDASCYPQAVPASMLAWVRPHPHEKACTPQELAAIGSSFSPTLSTKCAACFFSTTNESLYGAEVDFPQVTFVGYGFANVAGCVATLEPCNLPCAMLLEQMDLCGSNACLPSCHPTNDTTYTATTVCVESASSGCPCGAIVAAADECLNQIYERGSPAAACVPGTMPGETQNEAYLKELEAVTNALCGGLDGGVDAAVDGSSA